MKNNIGKVCVCVMIFMAGATILFAESPLENIQWVFGPRVGFSYVFMEPDDYSAKIHELNFFGEEEYIPFNSQFGFSLEQRIPLGTTKSHFVFQEVLSVGGIDQSIAIPTVAVLLGYRSQLGLEFGLGPVWSFDGFAVVYAAGWTFSFQGVYVPVNIIAVPDLSEGHHRVSFYTGFNFNLD
ncbi:MAG: hypothetical protein JXJ04_00115 [Spirochaetales bacterium]|nr:hypothetical protein [Spirochaetales bacterium]